MQPQAVGRMQSKHLQNLRQDGYNDICGVVAVNFEGSSYSFLYVGLLKLLVTRILAGSQQILSCDAIAQCPRRLQSWIPLLRSLGLKQAPQFSPQLPPEHQRLRQDRFVPPGVFIYSFQRRPQLPRAIHPLPMVRATIESQRPTI